MEWNKGGDYDEDEEDEYKDVNAKNAFVKIDIIGKLQMQGKITDVKKFSNYLDNADENDENEARFKSYINQANRWKILRVCQKL